MGRREIIIGVLLTGLGLGGTAVVSALTMTENIYTPYVLIGGLLFIGIVLFGLIYMFRTERTKAPPPTSSVTGTSISSHNQSGGITAHTVNMAPPRRDIDAPMSAPLKDQIRREVPKDQPITVVAVMGDGEASEFALQLHGYLRAQGYTMAEDGISQGMYSPPPINLHLERSEGGLEFVVGHYRP